MALLALSASCGRRLNASGSVVVGIAASSLRCIVRIRTPRHLSCGMQITPCRLQLALSCLCDNNKNTQQTCSLLYSFIHHMRVHKHQVSWYFQYSVRMPLQRRVYTAYIFGIFSFPFSVSFFPFPFFPVSLFSRSS